MIFILVTYFFLLGLIVGSFLNVIILRYNTGKTIGGRSACMSCKTQLTWQELIPVFSFLFQRGRCRTCNTKLNWQYPLVELATGVLFAANFWMWLNNSSSITELILSVGLTTSILALMIVVFVYDVRHKIIPDLFSFTMWGVSVLFILSSWVPNLFRDSGISSFNYETPKQVRGDTLFVIQHILAGLFFYFIIWLIWRISRGRAIGLGDAKLLLSIGTILGFVYGLSALFLAVWIGTMCALYILLKQQLSKRGKRITMKSEIPFGPFLIIGFLIVYFFGVDVTNITFLLENFS